MLAGRLTANQIPVPALDLNRGQAPFRIRLMKVLSGDPFSLALVSAARVLRFEAAAREPHRGRRPIRPPSHSRQHRWPRFVRCLARSADHLSWTVPLYRNQPFQDQPAAHPCWRSSLPGLGQRPRCQTRATNPCRPQRSKRTGLHRRRDLRQACPFRRPRSWSLCFLAPPWNRARQAVQVW